MLISSRNGVNCYRFHRLAAFDGLEHGIFGRLGGQSPPPFDSLNVGFSTGDDKANVIGNRRAIAECFEGRRLVFTHQVHGLRVMRVGPVECSARKGSDHCNPDGADALVTAVKNRMLVIQVADCQAVLIYDPVRCVAANVHAGWRGSIAGVVGDTLAVMTKAYGCRTERMVAGIGPSLGPCCAEFVNYRDEIPRRYWKYKGPDRRFDFWALTRDQLLAAGLLRDNIEVSRICTRCRTDLFFSYRAEATTGRFAAVIGLV
jgi:YfiH family protein